MYVTNIKKVYAVVLEKEGAHGVRVKYLLHKGVGAERFQLRLFTIEAEGFTPFERHRHEHEVFILQGKALIKGGDDQTVVGKGDVIYIKSWEGHQFVNVGEEEVCFLCTKETIE